MRLAEVRPAQITWDTRHDPHDHRECSHQVDEFCSHTGVHQCIRMEQVRGLNEATYKELAGMIDGNFLNQKIRADALNGIKLAGIEGNTMQFLINSSEYAQNRIQYQCSVQFDQWEEVSQDTDLNFVEKARLLLWVGNIRLHCTDPSFLYWGYQYLLTALDAAVYPEERKPQVKNPDERGIVCKHLNRILRVLPFYSGDIAKALKAQYGEG